MTGCYLPPLSSVVEPDVRLLQQEQLPLPTVYIAKTQARTFISITH